MRGESHRLLGLIAAALLLGVVVVLLAPRLISPPPPGDAGETARRSIESPARPVRPPGPPPSESGAPDAPAPARIESDEGEPTRDPGSPVPVRPGPDGESREEPPVVEEKPPEVARVVRDPVSDEPVGVQAGRAPDVEVAALIRDGLGSVSGTIRLTGEREVALAPGIPVGITGRVIERETKRPIPDATVILHSAFYVRTIFYDHHLEEVARVETDDDGEFRVRRLSVDPVHFGRGGLLYLTVRSPDHASRLAVPIQGVTPGYRNRLPDVVLDRGRHVIRGRVIDYWENKPVVGGRVIATGEIHPIHYPKDQREALFLSSPRAVTDEKGRFVLENVGPGTQILSVHGGDDCAGFLQVEVPPQGEVVIRSRQIRGHIEGRVVDEWVRPVPLVKVDGGSNSTHTFADGTFLLENFRGDVITLSFTHPEYRASSAPNVPDGTRSVVVRLTSRHPLIRFRIRSLGRDEPIPVVSIRLRFVQGNEVELPTSPFYVSGAGIHEVRVPAGAEMAEVSGEGYEPAEADLRNARDGDTIEVHLQRP